MKKIMLFVVLVVFFGLPAHAQILSWTEVSDVKPRDLQFSLSDGMGYAIVGSELFKTADEGKTWVPTAEMGNVRHMDVTEGVVFVLGSIIIDGTERACLYKSLDAGENWEVAHIFLFEISPHSMRFRDTRFGFVGDNGSLLKTTDGGESWRGVLGINPDNPIIDLQFQGLIGFYIDYDPGQGEVSLHKTIDGGDTWTYQMSIDQRVLWFSMFPEQFPYSIFFSDQQHIFLVSGKKIMKSTDGGSSFFVLRQDKEDLYSLVMGDGQKLFVAGQQKILISPDGGTTWEKELFTRASAYNSFSLTPLYIYLAGSGGIWRTDLITGFNFYNNTVSKEYDLSQNYPNPFNPETNIQFSLPKSGIVVLRVYDTIGREVATLVNQALTSGSYRYRFDGNALTSGIYFYKLEAGKFIETKKMIFLK